VLVYAPSCIDVSCFSYTALAVPTGNTGMVPLNNRPILVVVLIQLAFENNIRMINRVPMVTQTVSLLKANQSINQSIKSIKANQCNLL